jgi:predicted metal-dependent peptidase
MKLTAEQRIERAHVKLMQSEKFCLFSGVFMVGKVSVDDKHPTAYTNGRDVTYGREFVDRLNDKQLAFLVIHEAMHKAYRHMTVWASLAKKDPHLVNVAMDYVINLQIRDSDPYEEEVSMPRDENGKLMGMLDGKYHGKDTMQVYLELKEEQEGEDGEDEDGDDGEDSGGGGGTSVGNGQPKPSKGQSDDKSGSPSFDEHDWEGAKDLTTEEEEELQREIDSALREGAMLAGRMKGNVGRDIQELLHPKVDWREALRDFIKLAIKGGDQSTWRRPNRRYLGVDIIMPSAESRKPQMFVLGIDTSGSIGHRELAQFLSEVKSICEEVTPETIELLYWDSHVASRETYRGAEIEHLIETTKPKGGGGTEPECVPKYMIANQIYPQCVIMLTDGHFFGGGCGDWSGVNAPVLWCVKGNRDFKPTVGQSVYVEGV